MQYERAAQTLAPPSLLGVEAFFVEEVEEEDTGAEREERDGDAGGDVEAGGEWRGFEGRPDVWSGLPVSWVG